MYHKSKKVQFKRKTVFKPNQNLPKADFPRPSNFFGENTACSVMYLENYVFRILFVDVPNKNKLYLANVHTFFLWV